MHHGSTPDPTIDEALKDAEKLGATGLYPEGPLGELDEGEIRFGVAHHDGKILINFGKPVAWLGMSTDQAKDLARLLLKLANPITRGGS